MIVMFADVSCGTLRHLVHNLIFIYLIKIEFVISLMHIDGGYLYLLLSSFKFYLILSLLHQMENRGFDLNHPGGNSNNNQNNNNQNNNHQNQNQDNNAPPLAQVLAMQTQLMQTVMQTLTAFQQNLHAPPPPSPPQN